MNSTPGPPPPRSARSARSLTAWATLIIVMATALTIDLWSKDRAFENVASRPVVLDREQLIAHPEINPIPVHDGVSAFPWDLLDYHLVVNHGAVFGIGQRKRFLFIAFTGFALVAGLFVFGYWTSRRQHLAHVAIALILAGGVGNLWDRWQFGVVRDFLHMLPGRTLPFNWHWPGGSTEIFPWVFNGADVMLLTGMGLLMIHLNRLEKRKKLRAGERAATGESDAETDTSAPTEHTAGGTTGTVTAHSERE